MKGLDLEQKRAIARDVKTAREARGWSQAQLASEARLVQQVVARIENAGSYSLAALTAVVLPLGVRVNLGESIAPLRPEQASPFSPKYRELCLRESPASYTTMAGVERFIATATTKDILKISEFCIKEIGRRTKGDKA